MALALVLAALPTAWGVETVLDDQLCVDAAGCIPSTACLPGVACQSTPCDPANRCTGRAVVEESCRVNLTIDGESCATGVGAAASVGGRNIAVPGTYVIPGRPVPGASIDVPVTSFETRADLTRGFVYDLNLPNDWISHAAVVRATVLGVDLGETGVAVYQSSIEAEGGDDETHTFTHGGATARHEGAAIRTSASAGFVLLDGALESCSARAGPRDDVETTCEDVLGQTGL